MLLIIVNIIGSWKKEELALRSCDRVCGLSQEKV